MAETQTVYVDKSEGCVPGEVQPIYSVVQVGTKEVLGPELRFSDYLKGWWSGAIVQRTITLVPDYKLAIRGDMIADCTIGDTTHGNEAKTDAKTNAEA